MMTDEDCSLGSNCTEWSNLEDVAVLGSLDVFSSHTWIASSNDYSARRLCQGDVNFLSSCFLSCDTDPACTAVELDFDINAEWTSNISTAFGANAVLLVKGGVLGLLEGSRNN